MKKAILLLVLFAVLISPAFAINLETSTKGVKVDSDVINEVESGDVDVIVTLKESPESKAVIMSEANEKQRKKDIKKLQKNVLLNLKSTSLRKARAEGETSIASVSQNDYDFKIKYIYELDPSFAGKISKSGLRKLMNDPNVALIEKDRPVYATMDISAPLINATKVWNISVGGKQINGSGETICVIDTGVDYRHHALGGCNWVNMSGSETSYNESYLLNSPHDYENNYDNTWIITKPGWQNIRVHFTKIDVEEGYDVVYIYDGNDNQIQYFTGYYENIWSNSVSGDTIKVRLVSDYSVIGWGFQIELVGNQTYINPSYLNCSKVIDGKDYVNNDNDPMDDNGHGTHVAGTAAGMDSVYRGIAPGANIIAMKVLDSSGSGFFSDVKTAIDQCNVWRNQYNISIITMSIGDSTQNNNPASQCDPFATALSISAAYNNGQFVSVASGNDNYINGINYPACTTKATSVGSVYSKNWGGLGWGSGPTSCTDTVTWADKISCFTNRDEILDVLAPGALITSAAMGGGFTQKGGTSMATPMVAGVAALMQQYSKLRNGTALTPAQIESIMKSTGKNITDNAGSVTPAGTTGLRFPRVNALAALAGIGSIPVCGNNIIDFGEICDGNSINSSCSNFGYSYGSLSCLPDCSGYNTSNCMNCSAEVLINDTKINRTGSAQWNATSKMLEGNVTIKNLNNVNLYDAKAVIYWISQGSVSVNGNDGIVPLITVYGFNYSNNPYYSHGNITPNSSTTRNWKFYDPSEVPFDFATRMVAKYCSNSGYVNGVPVGEIKSADINPNLFFKPSIRTGLNKNVTFNCTANNGEVPLFYSLNFGDGTSLFSNSSINTIHNYDAGRYIAECVIINPDNQTLNSKIDLLIGSAWGSFNATLTGNYTFNTCNGTNAKDYSRFKNDGIVNGSTWVGSYLNQGLSFDGIDDKVTISGNLGSLIPRKKVTVEAWIYPTNNTGFHGIAGNWWEPAGTFWPIGYLLFQYNNKIVFYTGYGYDLVAVDSGSIANFTNRWHHVAGTYDVDAKQIKVYVNGVATTQNLPTAYEITYGLGGGSRIGMYYWDGLETGFFKGKIDEVKMYNYARTNAQIAADASAGISSVGC